jgi:hypothetical protein
MARATKNVSQFIDNCNQIRNLCQNGNFKKIEHKPGMEYSAKRTERLRRNGRLHNEEMEEIIVELKKVEETP